jgi:hypothetical protein
MYIYAALNTSSNLPQPQLGTIATNTLSSNNIKMTLSNGNTYSEDTSNTSTSKSIIKNILLIICLSVIVAYILSIIIYAEIQQRALQNISSVYASKICDHAVSKTMDNNVEYEKHANTYGKMAEIPTVSQWNIHALMYLAILLCFASIATTIIAS